MKLREKRMAALWSWARGASDHTLSTAIPGQVCNSYSLNAEDADRVIRTVRGERERADAQRRAIENADEMEDCYG